MSHQHQQYHLCYPNSSVLRSTTELKVETSNKHIISTRALQDIHFRHQIMQNIENNQANFRCFKYNQDSSPLSRLDVGSKKTNIEDKSVISCSFMDDVYKNIEKFLDDEDLHTTIYSPVVTSKKLHQKINLENISLLDIALKKSVSNIDKKDEKLSSEMSLPKILARRLKRVSSI